MKKTVFGAGLIVADHIFLSRGKGSKPEYLGTSGGGSVGNTLCLLSLLGHDCTVFGVVGNNSAANIIRSDFDLFGVSHSFLTKRGKPNQYVKSRQYSHIIDEKRRAHYFKRKCLKCGEVFTRDFQVAERDLTNKVKKAATVANVIHLDRANKVTIELATIGNKNNVPVTIDLGYTSFKRDEIVKELLQKSRIAKVNNKIFKQIIEAEGNRGLEIWQEFFPKMKTLVVTDGSNGAYGYYTHESRIFNFEIKAIPCKRVMDQSGAGDILMAIIISELLLGNRKKSKDDVIHSINRGQALASLNCSLFGARSLQRFFLRQDIRGKKILDIADEIVKDGEVRNSFDPNMGVPQNFSYIFRFAPETACSICGGPKRKIKKNNEMRKQSVYIRDLSQSLFVMAKSFEMSRLERGKFEDFRSEPVLFIGSGGSLSAALFGEQLLLQLYGIPSKAIAPFHLENLKVLKQDMPVCILSYGGENSDIIMGAALRISKEKIRNCLVLCGNKESKLGRIAKEMNWHFISLPGLERGFVSTVGMLAMISSLISILIPDNLIETVSKSFEHQSLNEILSKAERIAAEQSNRIDKTQKNLHMVCVASGWGMPALADFESKIVEGGICTIETAEMKNFTHGRYINTFFNRENRIMVVFESPEDKELSQFIQKKFRRYVPIIVVQTEKQGVNGALELIVKGLYLAGYIGKRKGIDIAKPQKYPPEARGLYGWEPKYRKNKEFYDLLKKVR